MCFQDNALVLFLESKKHDFLLSKLVNRETLWDEEHALYRQYSLQQLYALLDDNTKWIQKCNQSFQHIPPDVLASNGKYVLDVLKEMCTFQSIPKDRPSLQALLYQQINDHDDFMELILKDKDLLQANIAQRESLKTDIEWMVHTWGLEGFYAVF